MGDWYASLTLLADAVGTLERFVSVFVWVYILLIFAYVLSSWVRVPDALRPLVTFLRDVCEPYLRLFRRVLPTLGPVDLSPIVAVFALYIALWLVNNLLLDNLP
jgi:YggT family protein